MFTTELEVLRLASFNHVRHINMKFSVSRILFATIASALLLAGCATSQAPKAKTFANKDAAYVAKLKRIVLVAPLRPQSGRANVWPAIAEKLRATGVAVDVVSVDPLELNRGQAVREATRRFSATHVVVVESTAMSNTVRTGGYGASQDGSETFDIAIHDAATGKVHWRGKTILGYTRVVPGECEEAVAAALVAKLAADQLL